MADSHSRARRFLFYSHDGLGLGHVRRNMSIASALATLDPGASVLVATSAAEAESLGVPPSVDILKLPGLRKVSNERYAAKQLRVSWEDVQSVRSTLLEAAADSFHPQVVLADKHPLGVGGELRPALETARAGGARTVLGLRDVLDTPAAVKHEWRARRLFDKIRKHYDRVLVYGQPDLLDPRSEYEFPDDIAAMTSFCGYVVTPKREPGWREEGTKDLVRHGGSRPVVLATAGGGEDGFELLSTFIETASRRDWQAVVLAGPDCPPDRVKQLRVMAADAEVSFRTYVPGLRSELSSVDVLVCMGGYNTLVEAAATGVQTVCVPRVEPRREQLVRARAFARRGLVRVLEPGALGPRSLRVEIQAALDNGHPASANGDGGGHGDGNGNGALDTGGAERAARQLLSLASRPATSAAPRGGRVG